MGLSIRLLGALKPISICISSRKVCASLRHIFCAIDRILLLLHAAGRIYNQRNISWLRFRAGRGKTLVIILSLACLPISSLAQPVCYQILVSELGCYCLTGLRQFAPLFRQNKPREIYRKHHYSNDIWGKDT
jgi:hypothetical protein